MGRDGRELLILGLVRRTPTSAYDIARAVRGHAHLYKELKAGNIYDSLDGLTKSGLLVAGTAKALRGPRSEKSIFRLSADGEVRFMHLLRSLLTGVQTEDWILQIAYVLMGQLPRNAARRLLDERLTAIEDQQQRYVRVRGNIAERTGAAYISVAHGLYKLDAEARFLKEMVKHLDDARWSPEWQLGLLDELAKA